MTRDSRHTPPPVTNARVKALALILFGLAFVWKAKPWVERVVLGHDPNEGHAGDAPAAVETGKGLPYIEAEPALPELVPVRLAGLPQKFTYAPVLPPAQRTDPKKRFRVYVYAAGGAGLETEHPATEASRFYPRGPQVGSFDITGVPPQPIVFRAAADGIEVPTHGSFRLPPKVTLMLLPVPGQKVTDAERAYIRRVDIASMPTGSGGAGGFGLRRVITLPLEKYLERVVWSEGGNIDAPVEALKALAVAARSYVGFYLARVSTSGTICDSPQCLAFKRSLGPDAPKNVIEAVRGTQREVLVTMQGEMVPGFFHSTCGGTTVAAKDQWPGADAPPMLAVKDEIEAGGKAACAASPNFTWRFTLPVVAACARLSRAPRAGAGDGATDAMPSDDSEFPPEGEAIDGGPDGGPGALEDDAEAQAAAELVDETPGSATIIATDEAQAPCTIEVARRTNRADGGRVARVKVTEATGLAYELSWWAFQRALGSPNHRVRSNQFDLSVNGTDLVLTGRGFGHGVGLCQYGSVARAKAGAGYREILGAYFPGFALAKGGTPPAIHSAKKP